MYNVSIENYIARRVPLAHPRPHPLKKEETTMATTNTQTTQNTQNTLTAFEKRLAMIPEAVRLGTQCEPNSKGTAVHVLLNKTRVFGLSAVIVVNRKEFLGDLAKTAVKKNYGYVLPATAEVMTALYENAVADHSAKAAAKAKAEADKKAKAEEKAAAKAAAQKPAAEKPAKKSTKKATSKKPAAKKAAGTEAEAVAAD